MNHKASLFLFTFFISLLSLISAALAAPDFKKDDQLYKNLTNLMVGAEQDIKNSSGDLGTARERLNSSANVIDNLLHLKYLGNAWYSLATATQHSIEAGDKLSAAESVLTTLNEKYKENITYQDLSKRYRYLREILDSDRNEAFPNLVKALDSKGQPFVGKYRDDYLNALKPRLDRITFSTKADAFYHKIEPSVMEPGNIIDAFNTVDRDIKGYWNAYNGGLLQPTLPNRYQQITREFGIAMDNLAWTHIEEAAKRILEISERLGSLHSTSRLLQQDKNASRDSRLADIQKQIEGLQMQFMLNHNLYKQLIDEKSVPKENLNIVGQAVQKLIEPKIKRTKAMMDKAYANYNDIIVTLIPKPVVDDQVVTGQSSDPTKEALTPTNCEKSSDPVEQISNDIPASITAK